MLICICRQHGGCIVQSQGRKRNLVHIKNFIQSFMQFSLSSRCDAFVCYFRANQQQLTIRWEINSHHSAALGVYVSLGFTMGQILKLLLTCLASSPVGLVKNQYVIETKYIKTWPSDIWQLTLSKIFKSRPWFWIALFWSCSAQMGHLWCWSLLSLEPDKV